MSEEKRDTQQEVLLYKSVLQFIRENPKFTLSILLGALTSSIGAYGAGFFQRLGIFDSSMWSEIVLFVPSQILHSPYFASDITVIACLAAAILGIIAAILAINKKKKEEEVPLMKWQIVSANTIVFATFFLPATFLFFSTIGSSNNRITTIISSIFVVLMVLPLFFLNPQTENKIKKTIIIASLLPTLLGLGKFLSGLGRIDADALLQNDRFRELNVICLSIKDSTSYQRCGKLLFSTSSNYYTSFPDKNGLSRSITIIKKDMYEVSIITSYNNFHEYSEE